MNTEKTTSKREFRFQIDSEKGTVTIVNSTDETLRTFTVSKLPLEMRNILVVHGLKQKLTDDTMVSKIGEDGDRLLACDELWTRLIAGEWEKEREGIARAPEALIQFVMERKAISRAVATESLKKYGKAGWDAIKAANAEAIEKIEARIKTEKANAAEVDLTDL